MTIPPLVWDILQKEPAKDVILLPQVTPLPAPGALDTVLYDLKRNEKTTPVAAEHSDVISKESLEAVSVSSASLAPAPATNSAPTSAPTSPQISAEPPRRAVALDVQRPQEPEQISNARRNPESFDSNDNNSSTRVETSEPRIVDGGVALPPQFKEFSQSRFYVVRRETNVRSDPSIRSEAYAGLKRGIRVEVIGQQGYWLKIRSRSGRIGFILGEDAAIEADWAVQGRAN